MNFMFVTVHRGIVTGLYFTFGEACNALGTAGPDDRVEKRLVRA